MATVIAPDRLFTVDEYFEIEVGSDLKHEFNRGRIRTMTGASDNHVTVAGNLHGLLHAFLRRKPCRVYGENMRIEAVVGERYYYPDLSIACPPIEKKNIRGTVTLLNPAVVIEVLSPSTEAIDRGEKFNAYLEIESLREYFLISAQRAQVERWSRRADGKWTIAVTTGLDATMRIESIDCDLPLAEVYEHVELAREGSGDETPFAANPET